MVNMANPFALVELEPIGARRVKCGRCGTNVMVAANRL